MITPDNKNDNNRVDKSRVDKKNTSANAGESDKSKYTKEGADVIKAFEAVDPKNKGFYNKPAQREAADFLIREYGLDTVLGVVAVLPQTNLMEFIPQATTPFQLKENWVKISNALKKKGTGNKRGFII